MSPVTEFDPGVAAARLAGIFPHPPQALIVLGSGLSRLADSLESPTVVPFAKVPGLPRAGVVGHAGRFTGGLMGGRDVLVQGGRFHFYEGHPASIVAGTVRMAHRLGVTTLLLTNAAGGIHPSLEPGRLMLLDDHVDLTWRSPLLGPVQEGEERFPDMSAPYDPALQAIALAQALELGIPLSRGVYAASPGPSYETPAEVRALRRCGADAVGMSTVPEVIVARALGMRCLAVSVITNRAAGLGVGSLSHEEVLAAGRAAGDDLWRLLHGVVRESAA